MSTYRTTLADANGVVHSVTMPTIDAEHTAPVTPVSDCGAGDGATLPANMARSTAKAQFVGRPVTCPLCLTISPNGGVA